MNEIYENNIGDVPQNWVDEEITENDIYPYTMISEDELKESKIKPYFFAFLINGTFIIIMNI